MSKEKVNKDQRIGTTEIGDPCFHLEIFDNLYRGNIIITKHLTNQLCGNKISVKTLDLNLDFADIAAQLNAIVEDHFGLRKEPA